MTQRTLTSVMHDVLHILDAVVNRDFHLLVPLAGTGGRIVLGSEQPAVRLHHQRVIRKEARLAVVQVLQHRQPHIQVRADAVCKQDMLLARS